MSQDRQFDDIVTDVTRAVPYQARPDVQVSVRQQGAEKQHFLKSASGEILALREQEHFLWETLNASNSLSDIDRLFHARFGLGVTPQVFTEFLQLLIEANLVERVGDPASPAASARRIDVTYTPTEASGSPQPEEALEPRWPREPFTYVLFNPAKLLGALAFIFRPFRYLAWLLLPFAFFAFLIVIHNFTEYRLEFQRIFIDVAFWPAFLVGEMILNLLVRTTQGVAITSLGGIVRQFKVKFFLACWPRFLIDDSAVGLLPRHARLWVYASTLLTRLAVFALGTTLWGVYRETDGLVSMIGLGFGQLGLWTFLFCAFPLVPLDGYKWLATALNHPHQLGRSVRFLRMRASGRAAPQAMDSSDRWGLVLFGGATVLWMTISIGWIVASLAIAVLDRFQGVGFLLLLAQFSAATFYVVLVRRHSRRLEALRDRTHATARRLAADYGK